MREREAGSGAASEALGGGGEGPGLVRVEEFEAAARERLPRAVYDFYAGGAGDEWTLRENVRAFDRWLLRPRVLEDVSSVDLTATVLGRRVAFPVLVAPTAMQRLAHEDGELATARGAAALGTVMVLSTVATCSLEEVAAAAGPRWFQLYVHRDRGVTADLVARAEAAGYEALVLTVDAPFLGRRYRDERNRFALPPPGLGLANFAGGRIPAVEAPTLSAWFRHELDPSLSWRDVEWLRSRCSLPLALKGVLTADDALLAVDAGARAVIVSNHGGRQLDGVPASVDALPEVVEAAAGRAEVLLDGGVRRGTDVLRALALGASAVLVGRPVLWGLAVDGEAGVRRVLGILRDELELAMALAGRSSIGRVDRSTITRGGGRGEER